MIKTRGIAAWLLDVEMSSWIAMIRGKVLYKIHTQLTNMQMTLHNTNNTSKETLWKYIRYQVIKSTTSINYSKLNYKYMYADFQ